MNKEYPYFMITFPTVHHALKFEAVFKETKTGVQLVPVPREISSSCGVAAKVFASNFKLVISSMENNRLEYDAIYVYQASGKGPRFVQEY